MLEELKPLLMPMVAPLAEFQRWLYQTDNPALAIAEMIRERHGAFARSEHADVA